IKVLLNHAYDQPLTIIQYDLPALLFGEHYQHFFPVVGPIGAVLEGNFDGRVDFAIGYDTKGIKNGGLSNFDEGFYISTPAKDAAGTEFYPIGRVLGGIAAGAGISIGVATGAVLGEIDGLAEVYLDNVDELGRLRL